MNKVQKFCAGLAVLLVLSANSYGAPRSTPVMVTNTESEPVPVTVIDTPTAINICATLAPFSGGRQPIYDVPAGQMLVIEFASIDPVDTMDDGEFAQVQIRTTANGVEGTFLAGKVSGSEFTFARDGRVLKIYADPGTEVVGGIGSRGYLGEVEVCLSGQLRPTS